MISIKTFSNKNRDVQVQVYGSEKELLFELDALIKGFTEENPTILMSVLSNNIDKIAQSKDNANLYEAVKYRELFTITECKGVNND